MRLEVAVVQARLRAPLAASHGTVATRPLVHVRLTDSDGFAGEGEAAPLQSYDGVSVQSVLDAIESWRPALEAGEFPPDGLPQARSAIDLALWDLRGKRAGVPVWRLLGADAAPRVPVNFTIGAEAPAQAASLATHAREAGFPCVKVKVGDELEFERVRAVRAALGSGVALRLDANGAWETPARALLALEDLCRFGIELCEEPVHGAAALARVQAGASCPVAADESAGEALRERVCRAMCLKVTGCGGITGVIEGARRARELGYEVYLASTLDGPLGIAAALHCCATVRVERPCGLATLGRLEMPDPLGPQDGTITAPSGTGLGLRKFSPPGSSS